MPSINNETNYHTNFRILIEVTPERRKSNVALYKKLHWAPKTIQQVKDGEKVQKKRRRRNENSSTRRVVQVMKTRMQNKNRQCVGGGGTALSVLLYTATQKKKGGK
jgi:hypothetical protein